MHSRTGSHSPHFPSDLEFGSYLVYPSPAKTEAEQNPKAFILAVKRDAILKGHGSAIQLAIRRLRQTVGSTPLVDWLDGTAILVPTPASGLLLRNAVWSARSICQAMVAAGLGSKTLTCVQRIKPIRKSAYCEPGERPTLREHYDTMIVKAVTDRPQNIVLVDDVITRGATLGGGAARLMEAFPDARVRAFAIAHTESDMKDWISPCLGRISCWTDGGGVNRVVS
jgi:hypothetical protein